MNSNRSDEINVLKLTLHGHLVGYLAGFLNGRNVLSFAEEFVEDPGRPTFSLITHPSFPHSEELMAEPWARNQKLHPSLSKEGLINPPFFIVEALFGIISTKNSGFPS